MSDALQIRIDDVKFRQLIARYPDKVKSAVKNALQAGALLVQNRSKQLSPYLTGNLRRSITNKIQDDEASIGTDVVYAATQEFGDKDRGIPPYKNKGYLRPALQEVENQVIDIFSKEINKIKL